MNKIIHTLHALACLCLVLAKGASSGSALDPKPDQGTDIDIHPIFSRELIPLDQASTQGLTCGKGLPFQGVEPWSGTVFSYPVTDFLSGFPGSFFAPDQKLPEVPEAAPNSDTMSDAEREEMSRRGNFHLRLSDELSTMLDNHPNLCDVVISKFYKEFGLSLDLRFMRLCTLTKEEDGSYLTGTLPSWRGCCVTAKFHCIDSNTNIRWLFPDEKLGLNRCVKKMPNGAYRFNKNRDAINALVKEIFHRCCTPEEKLEINWSQTEENSNTTGALTLSVSSPRAGKTFRMDLYPPKTPGFEALLSDLPNSGEVMQIRFRLDERV